MHPPLFRLLSVLCCLLCAAPVPGSEVPGADWNLFPARSQAASPAAPILLQAAAGEDCDSRAEAAAWNLFGGPAVQTAPYVQTGEFPAPAIVYFTSARCVPCRRAERELLPWLKKSGWPIITIDMEQLPETAARHAIDSAPTFLVYQRNAAPVRRVGWSGGAAEFAAWRRLLGDHARDRK